MKLISILFCTLLFTEISAQEYVLSGHISNLTTGENLTGASVVVENESATGTITNHYGFYSLMLPAGSYRILFRFIGYEPVIIPVNLDRNQTLDVELQATSYKLGDIHVTANRPDRNISSMDLGVTRIIPQEVEDLPVLFGEPDILKVIQLTPGVKPAGEGNSGFHVRGGGIGQNLILLDEAQVYNPSHLLGFFSVFNSEALTSADVMKGSVPAEFGGKAASVLDVHMKEGNMKKLGASGKVGLIASNLTVEGPLVRDRGSFMISGRRTYADMFLNFSDKQNVRNSKLYFYDLNLKTNYRINAKNRIFLSGYLGQDAFDYRNDFSLNWGSITGTLRWNHVFSEKLFSNTTFVYSNYSSDILLILNYNINFHSVINDLNLKQDFSWYINSRNTVKFGFNVTDHSILPGRINLSGSFGIDPPENVAERKALEYAAYLSNNQHLTKRLRFYYGLRFSAFSNMGPGDYYVFDKQDELVQTISLKNKSIFNTSTGIEPRVAINYKINPKNSVKASYSRMHQYLHLLSNTTTSVATEIWLPSSNNVKPQIADQVSLGLFSNMANNAYESSLEVYYKDLQNQIEYKNAAELVYNSTIESELAFGRGWAYGAEFLMRRNTGRLKGWLGYTWSKTMRQFDEVNGGKPFPANHDRTHDVSAVMMYDLFTWLKFSAVWVYYTGNAVTFPRGKYRIEGKTVSYYTERNGFRMPDYHRLDLSLVIRGKPRDGYQSSWNLSLYNAYGRENAYIIKFKDKRDNPGEMEAVKVFLFKAVPSLSYSFRF